MSLTGCSSNTVKSEDPDKVDDINHIAESLSEDKPSEIDAANIQHEDENNVNISNDEAETTKDISIKGEKIELSPEEQKEINIFLSNFTEISFLDFKGKPSNDILIDFAIWHNDINNFKAFEIKGNYGFLDKAIVERSIKRFFGLNVQHQKTGGYDFDGNNYIIPMATGGVFPMAVVQEMYDNNDGSYTVYFDEVFTNESLDYSITPQKLQEEIKSNPDIASLGDSKKAIVERHNFEGKSRYKLIEYVTISE